MELRHLRTFVALAEERHFGRAAKRVRATQSAVSQQLKRLEDVVGVELVSRSRVLVKLNAAGQVFLDHARRTLAEADAALSATRRAAAGEVGRLSLALSTPALSSFVPIRLRAFRKDHPDLELLVRVLASDEQEAALLAGTIDLGFTSLAPLDPALEALEIGREPFGVALPDDHPLASRGTLRLDELRDEQFIMVRRSAGPAVFNDLVASCGRAGFDLQVVQEVVAFPSIVGLVMTGVSIAFVPPSLAPLGRRGMTIVPIEGSAPELPLYLTCRRNDLPPAAQRMRSFISRSDVSTAGSAE